MNEYKTYKIIYLLCRIFSYLQLRYILIVYSVHNNI